MESDNNLSFGWEAAILTPAPAGNPYLALGLLLAYYLLGLATVIGAFVYHRGKLSVVKGGFLMAFSGEQHNFSGVQNLYPALLVLVVLDLLIFVIAMIFVGELASSCTTGFHCDGTFRTWYFARWNGLIAQLLCALVCLIYLSQPQQGPRLRAVTMGVTLVTVFCAIIYLFAKRASVYLLAAITIGLTATIIAKYLKSSVSSSVPPVAHTVKKLIMAAAMCTFFIVFLPSFILLLLTMNANSSEESTKYDDAFGIVVFSTNCLLIIDGFMCFLILKLSAAEEEHVEQQQQEQQQ